MAYKALIKRQDWDFVVFRYAFKAVRIDDTEAINNAVQKIIDYINSMY